VRLWHREPCPALGPFLCEHLLRLRRTRIGPRPREQHVLCSAHPFVWFGEGMCPRRISNAHGRCSCRSAPRLIFRNGARPRPSPLGNIECRTPAAGSRRRPQIVGRGAFPAPVPRSAACPIMSVPRITRDEQTAPGPPGHRLDRRLRAMPSTPKRCSQNALTKHESLRCR
jgi:hypothetical protein